tara:strand:+ start:4644 stop:6773 length:2130 start_codon:yes stop_codon:yes gene_type:complete
MSYPRSAEDRLEYWKRIITHAERYYEPYFDACKVLKEQYEMSPSSLRENLLEEYSEDPGFRVKANIVFAWIEQMIANQASRDPEVVATATNMLGVGAEKSVGPILNYFYRETEQLEQDKRVLLDGYLSIWGVWKLGYAVDYDSLIEREVSFRMNQGEMLFDSPESDFNHLVTTGLPTVVDVSQDQERFIEFHTMGLQDPMVEADSPGYLAVQDNIAERKRMLDRGSPDDNTSVKWEGPWALRWKPSDFLIDPEAQDALRDAGWIAFRFRRRLDDVKYDPMLKNASSLEPTSRLNGASDISDGESDPFEMVEGWEIWARQFPIGNGRRRNLRMVIVDSHDKFLLDEQEWPYDRLEDYPAEVMSFTRGIDTWFNKPTLIMSGGDSQQSLMNEILDGVLSVVRKQKNIFLYDPELFDDTEVEELLTMPDMSALPVPGLSKAAGGAIQPIQFGQVQSDKNALLNTIQVLFDRAAGSPQPLSSINPESATEADIVDRSASSRENERTSSFNRAILRKVRKWWQLITEFYDPADEKIYLINPSGVEMADRFATISEQMAKGEYFFRIDMSSHQDNKVLERRQGLDLLNLVSGLVPLFQEIYGQPPNIAAILERVMRRGFDWEDVQEVLPFIGQEAKQPEPPPNPADALMAQLGQAPPEGQAPPGAPVSPEAEILNQAVAAGKQQGPMQGGAFNAAPPSVSNQQAANIRPMNNQGL